MGPMKRQTSLRGWSRSSRQVVPYKSRTVATRSQSNAVTTGAAIDNRRVGRMPLYKALYLVNKAVHTFVQRNKITLPLSSSGFNDLGLSIVFGVSQDGFKYSIAGGAWTSVAWNNASNYPQLFSEYRIASMDIEFFYSNNNSTQTAAAATVALPQMIHYTDVQTDGAAASTQEALCYATAKYIQLGNSSGTPNGRQIVKMTNPACYIGTTNDDTLAGTLVSSMIRRNQWISTNVVDIPHGFHKFYLDYPVVWVDNSGYITFVISSIQQYKTTQ